LYSQRIRAKSRLPSFAFRSNAYPNPFWPELRLYGSLLFLARFAPPVHCLESRIPIFKMLYFYSCFDSELAYEDSLTAVWYDRATRFFTINAPAEASRGRSPPNMTTYTQHQRMLVLERRNSAPQSNAGARIVFKRRPNGPRGHNIATRKKSGCTRQQWIYRESCDIGHLRWTNRSDQGRI
jgi:hypothetical protein